MQIVEGVVFLARENQFQVLDAEGTIYRFIISPSSLLGRGHVSQRQRAGEWVRILCVEAVDPLNAMAHAIAWRGRPHTREAAIHFSINEVL